MVRAPEDRARERASGSAGPGHGGDRSPANDGTTSGRRAATDGGRPLDQAIWSAVVDEVR